MNNRHQPENDLLDALKNTVAEAEKEFQDNLEEQVMAGLQKTSRQQNTEDIKMRLFSEKMKRNQNSSRSILTLVAAVLAIVVTGGLIFFAQGEQSNLTLQDVACDYSGEQHSYQVQSGDTLLSISNQFGVSIDHLVEINCFDENAQNVSVGQNINIPISLDIEPIENAVELHDELLPTLVATRNIALNEVITMDMIMTIYLHQDDAWSLAEDNQGVWYYSAEDEVLGQYANSIIHAYEPITNYNITDTKPCIDEVANCELINNMMQYDDYLSMVVALHDIIPGEIISDDMVTTVYYDQDDASWPHDEDFPDTIYYNEQTAIGQRAITFIPYHKPITNHNVTDSRRCIDDVTKCTLITSTINHNDGFAPLVIAKQDIPLNTMITEQMLLTVLVPNDFMNELQPMESSLMNVLNSPELAIGQYATTLIRAYEPILSENIREANECDDKSNDCQTLPEGYIAFALPADNLVPLSMQAGQHVDVLMPLQLIERFNGEKQVVSEVNLPLDMVPELKLETIVLDAILIETTYLGEELIVTLAVKAPDYVMLERVASTEQIFRFVPHVPIVESDFVIRTEDGLTNISVPVPEFDNDSYSEDDIKYVTFSAGFNEEGIRLDDPIVRYLGRGSEEYVNPNGDDSLFLVVAVHPELARSIEELMEDGASVRVSLDS